MDRAIEHDTPAADSELGLRYRCPRRMSTIVERLQMGFSPPQPETCGFAGWAA